MLKKLIAVLKEKQNSLFLLKDNKKRIILTSCPSGGVYDKVIKEIENLNAIVVAFENCTRTKNYQNLVKTNGDLYENLVGRYLKFLVW